MPIEPYQHFEGFDTEPDLYSKSSQKRAAQELRKLVEQIADLGEQSFKALLLPQDLQDAISVARKMRPRSDERRRQLQYAAKILRSYPELDLKTQLTEQGRSAKADPKTMRLEQLRSAMIVGGKKAIDLFCAQIKDTDRSKLRQLVAKAAAEAALGNEIPHPAGRQLFRHLKAELARAGIEIPPEILELNTQTVSSSADGNQP